MAARLGVADHVIFGGFQPDTAAMMAAFDLLRRRLGPGDIRAGHTRGDGQRPAGGLHCLPGAGRDPDQSGPSGRQELPEAMRAEIRKAVEGGPQPREPDSAVFGRYGMESVTRQVDDLYEQTLARRGRHGRQRQ